MSPVEMQKRRGLMLVLSSPSGAGKTALSRCLLADDGDVVMSVSATTRTKRPGEEEGKDYFFVSHADFQTMIDENALLEHARVFDNHYGTPKAPVEKALAEGRDVLFDIDWQGTQQLSEAAGHDLVRVFILPPSIAELEARLRKRAQDPEAVIQKRMAQAESEISHWAEYDYVLINEDFDISLQNLKTVLAAERLKRTRQPGLSTFVRSLKWEKNPVE